jgi:hypothetical protein
MVRWCDDGITGNGNLMLMEKNNREVRCSVVAEKNRL